MTTLTNAMYRPPRPEQWQGRNDSPPAGRLFQRVRCQDLRAPFSPETSHEIAFLGFACDEGVSRNMGRPGAASGPAAFRSFAASMPTHLSEDRRVLDCGDILCPDHALGSAQERLGAQVARLIQEGRFPLLIGGGHEIAWGTMQGLLKAYPDESIGILNFDAHLDMRPLPSDGKGHSGTGFRQIADAMKARGLEFDYLCLGLQPSGNSPALLKTGEEYGVHTVNADDFHQWFGARAADEVEALLERRDKIYVTVCLDVFSASVAPGVSAPQPLGILPWHVTPLLEKLARSGKVVGLDFAEYSPERDVDGHTGRLLASLVFAWMHAFGTEQA